MIELPEARTIAKDLEREILGKEIISVGGNFTDHKFTFYDDAETYPEKLTGKKITAIHPRNFYIEIQVEDKLLLFRDGANIRYLEPDVKLPPKSKLLLSFEDASHLNVTTSMYAYLGLIDKDTLPTDNEYYLKELSGVGALDEAFTWEYFQSLRTEATDKLSAKAFLATDQRILGIGNGVTQDILLYAGLNPKRKLATLSEVEYRKLYDAIQSTLKKMVNEGGRNTEKNIYGNPGGYQTLLSAKTYKNGCPFCGGEIVKASYMGGSIYFCPECQPIDS